MSAEISIRKNGMAEFASLEGTHVWWGGAQVLKEGAPIEEWITQSGMDWRVQRSEIRYAVDRENNEKTLRTWPDQHVLFRSDTKAPLATVSAKFKVVQPREAVEFFRELCQHNGFKMRTAGVLFGGRRYWALADIGEESYVADKRDRVKGRLLLATACDGSMNTLGKFVAECVVCNNTLTMARAESGKQVKVSHRSVFNASDVKAQLGLASGQWNAFIMQARDLADRKVSVGDVADFMSRLIADKPVKALTAAEGAELQAERVFKKLMDKIGGNAIAHDMPGRDGTAWGLVNAVTEYVDHDMPARSDGNRLNSAQFGVGDELKSKALGIALAMV